MHIIRSAEKHGGIPFELSIGVPTAGERDVSRATSLLKLAQKRIGDLLAMVDERRGQNCVVALNAAKSAERVRFHHDAFELLLACERVHRQTRRCFDPSKSEFPDGEFDRTSDRFGFDVSTNEVWKNRDDVTLCFESILDAHALDEARKIILAGGFRNYLLNAGNRSLIVEGMAAGEFWLWAWPILDGPRKGRAVFRHLSGEGIAIAFQGRSLVAHPSAFTAAAFAEALVNLGWNDGHAALSCAAPALAMAERTRAGHFVWNSEFQKFWGSPTAAEFLVAETPKKRIKRLSANR